MNGEFNGSKPAVLLTTFVFLCLHVLDFFEAREIPLVFTECGLGGMG